MVQSNDIQKSTFSENKNLQNKEQIEDDSTPE